MTHKQLSPRESWKELRHGNDRFVAGKPYHPRQDVDTRNTISDGQTPIAALFGCSDSRLAAEIIFDLGLGDLFVVRNAGQVISESVIGSLEYAVGVLNVPLVLVLGHDKCGAVQEAILSQSETPKTLPVHIKKIIDTIVPAVRRVAGSYDTPLDPADVDAAFVGREHVRDTVNELISSSELMSTMIKTGKVAIVGANYRLIEGRVETDVVVGVV